MKREWLQIVTNVGVLLGLVAVVYQIEQANQHALAGIADSSYQLNAGNLNQLMGENPAFAVSKAMTDPANMTDSDRVTWDARLQQVMYEAEFYYTMEQVGIYKQPFWHEIVRNMARRNLAYPLGLEWWAKNREWQNPTIQGLIDEALDESPDAALEILRYGTTR